MNSCRNSQAMLYGREKCQMEMPAMPHSGFPLAISYVPMQKWQNLYQPDEALRCGTIFKDLSLPFTGRRVC